MIEGQDDNFKPYTSNFTCEPGDVVLAFCASTNEFFTDSPQVTCVYSTDNTSPIAQSDDVTVNIVYNTHLFANNDSRGYDVGDTDEGTAFGINANDLLTSTIVDPLSNDSDPDGDELRVSEVVSDTNELPIDAIVSDSGMIAFVPSDEVGLLGFRRSTFFDQESYRDGSVITTDVNDSYNAFWADIASVYNFNLSEEGKAIENGSRQDENGTFSATDRYTYTITDGFGGEDSGQIACRVQELTVLSPIAIDTDGSGAIELSNNVQSFDFTANGSKAVSYTHLTLPTTPYV